MNFYLSAIDDLLRHPDDRPSIGIILCKDRNEVVVEYALRDSGKPMGVAQYRLSAAVPEQLKDDLPSPEDLAGVVTAAREALFHSRPMWTRSDEVSQGALMPDQQLQPISSPVHAARNER